jgi:hypothetical protein
VSLAHFKALKQVASNTSTVWGSKPRCCDAKNSVFLQKD